MPRAAVSRIQHTDKQCWAASTQCDPCTIIMWPITGWLTSCCLTTQSIPTYSLSSHIWTHQPASLHDWCSGWLVRFERFVVLCLCVCSSILKLHANTPIHECLLLTQVCVVILNNKPCPIYVVGHHNSVTHLLLDGNKAAVKWGVAILNLLII